MTNIALVLVGGGIGSVGRYLVSLLAGRLFGDAFPAGTLMVNLLGCFLIGLFAGLADRAMIPRELRLFLVTGLLGGLTTFSTFSLESVRFMMDGAGFLGFANIALNVVAGLGLTLLGFQIAAA